METELMQKASGISGFHRSCLALIFAAGFFAGSRAADQKRR
jgi:hypothetical protein